MIARLIIGSAVVLSILNVAAWAQRINTAPPVSAPPIHVGPPVTTPSVVVTPPPPPPPPSLNQPVATPMPIPCTDERRRRGQC